MDSLKLRHLEYYLGASNWVPSIGDKYSFCENPEVIGKNEYFNLFSQNMDTILSLLLKMTYFGVVNNKVRLKFESNFFGWIRNRYVMYECEFNNPKSLCFGHYTNALITGQNLLKSKMKIRIFLNYKFHCE